MKRLVSGFDDRPDVGYGQPDVWRGARLVIPVARTAVGALYRSRVVFRLPFAASVQSWKASLG